MYAQLSPDQRASIAQEFIQRYQQSGDPSAQQFANLDPNSVTPDQLAQMHQQARQNNPGIFGEVMRHPVITAAIGGFAAYELHKHLEERHEQR